MPYGDANAVAVDMAREVLPIVERTHVLAGVCGTRSVLGDAEVSGGVEGDGVLLGCRIFRR